MKEVSNLRFESVFTCHLYIFFNDHAVNVWNTMGLIISISISVSKQIVCLLTSLIKQLPFLSTGHEETRISRSDDVEHQQRSKNETNQLTKHQRKRNDCVSRGVQLRTPNHPVPVCSGHGAAVSLRFDWGEGRARRTDGEFFTERAMGRRD